MSVANDDSDRQADEAERRHDGQHHQSHGHAETLHEVPRDE